MTEPVALARPKTARRLASLATAGVLGTLSPVALAAPATAAPTSAACPQGLGATAASETLALRLLDLRGVGVPLPPVADVHAATTHSGTAGGPSRSAADARYLRAKVLGATVPTGVLDAYAYQQAPPNNEHPKVVPAQGVDLGLVKLGTGGLSAHAQVRDAAKCEPSTGPRARSSAKLASTSVLPGPGGRALLRLDAVESATSTEVTAHRGQAGARAAAVGSVADFQLLAGTPAAIGVKVISAPKLEVAATPRRSGVEKDVRYDAPVLEVTVPGKAPSRLTSSGSHVELVVPVDPQSKDLASDLGRAEGLPVLEGLPLADLLTGLSGAPGGNAGASPAHEGGNAQQGVNGLLGALPGLPVVGGLTGLLGSGAGEARPTEGGRAHKGRVVVLRLQLGAVEKQYTDTGVYAKAISLRVQVLVRSKWAGHDGDDDGYGGKAPADRATLLDLGVCTLEAAAAAPKATGGYGHGDDDDDNGGGSGGGSGSDDDNGGGGTGGGNNGGGGGGTAANPPAPSALPVTGNRVGLVLGAGVLMVLAGRFLMLVARRRSTT